MAAIDLRAAVPMWTYTFTAATTWQEILLPARCRGTVTIESGTGYLAGPANGATASPEAPTNGGAVGTHRQLLGTADAPYSFRMTPTADRLSGQSIFIAATTGTPTVSVLIESCEV
jgi:hypothetical protein